MYSAKNFQCCYDYMPESSGDTLLWNFVACKPWPMPEVVNKPSQCPLMADGRLLGHNGPGSTSGLLVHFMLCCAQRAKNDKKRWKKIILSMRLIAAWRVISIWDYFNEKVISHSHKEGNLEYHDRFKLCFHLQADYIIMFVITCFKMLFYLFPVHYSWSIYQITKAETISPLINRQKMNLQQFK